jgi:hypothetical protein
MVSRKSASEVASGEAGALVENRPGRNPARENSLGKAG